MPKTDPPATWRGFTPVFYTQIPDEFFDVWLPHLSGAECKVLCYFMRHTFGWKRTHDRISLGQITNGIVRRDGVRLDGGAGVSRGGAQLAIDGLVRRGLIVVEPTERPDGGHGANRYYIRMADQPNPSGGRKGAHPPEPDLPDPTEASPGPSGPLPPAGYDSIEAYQAALEERTRKLKP